MGWMYQPGTQDTSTSVYNAATDRAASVWLDSDGRTVRAAPGGNILGDINSTKKEWQDVDGRATQVDVPAFGNLVPASKANLQQNQYWDSHFAPKYGSMDNATPEQLKEFNDFITQTYQTGDVNTNRGFSNYWGPLSVLAAPFAASALGAGEAAGGAGWVSAEGGAGYAGGLAADAGSLGTAAGGAGTLMPGPTPAPFTTPPPPAATGGLYTGFPSVPPGTGSLLSNLLGTNPNTTDALGKILSSGLGAYNADQTRSAYNELADKFIGIGAPYRDKLNASYQPGFSMNNEPGYAGALDNTMQSYLRKASTGGNPFENPGVSQEILTGVNNSLALPALQNYRSGLTNAGQIGLNTGAQAEGNAVQSGSNVLGSLGAGIGGLTTPTTDYSPFSDLLKQVDWTKIFNRSGTGIG